MSTSMETTGSLAGCGYHQGLASREKTLNDIMSMLRDDDISIIRIHGPDGAGKNILTEKAAILAVEEMLFEEILTVVISNRIHTSVIDPKYFNLTLPSNLTKIERAKCLSDKLERRKLTDKHKRKSLLILSDVEEKLDLDDVRIPSYCKVVLTSRENIYEKMGAKIENIVEVGRLTASEAHDLFLNQLGVTVDINDSKLILEKMLKSCRLLPLSIEILANILRNQRPHVWGGVAQNLEKFSNEEIAGMSSEIYSVVKLSFSFILEEEKRLLFLLCCLSPSATCVDMPNLLIYGIGLGLFEHLTSLVEAIDQAYRWADDLVSSSLFMKVDSTTGEIWINDVVREAGRLLAKTVAGKRLFYAGAISPRHEEKTYRQYTAIAMMPDSDCGDLNGWDFPQLELLLLSYTYVKELSDDYFIRMQNLKVLDFSNSRIQSLPPSFLELINLHTLLLEYSYIGVSSIHQICSLINLQVISLKGSDIATLPKEIGNLANLKFLDLTDCQKLRTIPPGVLRCFTLLEGLLIKNCFYNWGTEGNTELSELKLLTCLRVLKIRIQPMKARLYDWDSYFSYFLGLVFFDIIIEGDFLELILVDMISMQHYSNIPLKNGTFMSRNLRVVGMDANWLMKEGCRSLVQKSENLSLSQIEGLTDIVPSLDEDGLNGLHTLVVIRCNSMRYLTNLSEGINSLTTFRTLRSLVLVELKSLEGIMFHWEPSEDLFPNLQEVVLSGLKRLQVFSLPIPVTTRLKVLRVSDCESLEYIFTIDKVMEVEEVVANTSACEVKFSSLQELDLRFIPRLRWFLKDRDSTVGETLRPFFSGKTEFPSLNVLRMHNLPCIRSIWELDTTQDSVLLRGGDFHFPCLKILSLSKMHRLKMVIDTKEQGKGFGSEIIDHKIVFPLLEKITLIKLLFLRTFCSTSNPMEFPSLTLLDISKCPYMESFLSSSTLLTPKLRTITGGPYQENRNKANRERMYIAESNVRHKLQLISEKPEGPLIQNPFSKGKDAEDRTVENWTSTTLGRKFRKATKIEQKQCPDMRKISKWYLTEIEKKGNQVETNFNTRSTASESGHADSSNQSAPSHPVELSLNESWKLFKSESGLGGELLDSEEAHHYVETIVQKCNGLVLTIKITARALRTISNLEELELASLEFPSYTNPSDYIMQQLKFSYGRLKSPELKKCFLLTSLFEKDKSSNVSTLVSFMIDQGLCSDEIVDVYAWGYDQVRALIDAALLESVQDDTVRMHDLVRDMALDVILSDAEIFTNFGGSNLTSTRATVIPGSEKASSSAVLAHVGANLKEPPSAEKWEQAKMVFLMDNEFPTLPEKPACPDLFSLFLHRNSSLREIPQNFFSSMPRLQVLNLSKTRISSLPQSLVNLTSLQELILRDCERLFIIPEYVGKLTLLQVLDLQGTELSHLPDSVHELINLKKLMVSFYGTTDICELAKLPIIMSEDVISMPKLREVGIFVYPSDMRWESCANEITMKLNTMSLVATSIHFLKQECFEAFIRENDSWRRGQLKKFNFIVGPDAERNASEIPYDVQLMYNHQEQCLKFVSGQDISSPVVEVLRKTRAFYVDHHVSILDLSEFGFANMRNVRVCIVRDCPVLLGCFLVSRIQDASLSNMKVFELNSCPKVKFVFTWRTLVILMTNLEQLIIEDCVSLESIVAKDNEDGGAPSTAGHPKRLRVLRLHMLPQLKDVWSGRPWPCLEDISISYCQKLKNLQLSRTCIAGIKRIRAEKDWWNSLEWDEEDGFVKHYLENNCKVASLNLDDDNDVNQDDADDYIDDDDDDDDVDQDDDDDNHEESASFLQQDTSLESEEATRPDEFLNVKSINEGHESVPFSSHELPHVEMGSVESSVPEIMSALESKPDARDVFDEVKILPPEEAWKLFQSQLGDGFIDSLEVRQYAEIIMEKCQGLDLIIKITARSLRLERNPKEWELASRDFQSRTSSNTVHDHILQQLKFSYDRLGSHELRKCFLLSSLFEKGKPIYCSNLLNYMTDQGWSSKEMVDFNTWGHNLLKGLIDAGLLEPGQDDMSVRMHDLVRDMGLDVILTETETFDGFGGLYFTFPQSAAIHNHSERRSSSFVLSQVGARRNQPPSVEKWEQAKMVFLMDNEFVRLPEELDCSSLFALSLHRNSNLRIIPEYFFNNMPGLISLNLSRTKIDSLPPSITCLRSLQLLVLRDCERLFILPEYVGELIYLQVLDLHGTELCHLPDSIGRLKNLKKLLVSFYGTIDRSEAAKLPKIMSEEVISIPELREVGIFVYPSDMRWASCAEEITVKLSTMNLDAISIHFLQEDWFESFILNNNSWKCGQLKKFNFIVGPDAERSASEIPCDVLLMYNYQDQCLKFVSGHNVSATVKKVLEETSAFYLDHHVSISDLSEFGLASMSNVKLCIVRECPVLKCFLDTAIPPECTLSNLRLLSLNSCPNVKFVLSWSAVEILNNLEQLIVQDCPALECIVTEEKDGDTTLATYVPPRSLRVVRLHMLPQLRDVWHGRPWPYLEDFSISYCQKLKNLHLSLTSVDSIKCIRAEKTWWNSLEWNDYSLKLDLENNHKVVYIDSDIDNEDEDLDHEM